MTPLLVFLAAAYAAGCALAVYAYRRAPQILDEIPSSEEPVCSSVRLGGRVNGCACRRCSQRHSRQRRPLRMRHTRLHLRPSAMGARTGSFGGSPAAQ